MHAPSFPPTVLLKEPLVPFVAHLSYPVNSTSLDTQIPVETGVASQLIFAGSALQALCKITHKHLTPKLATIPSYDSSLREISLQFDYLNEILYDYLNKQPLVAVEFGCQEPR